MRKFLGGFGGVWVVVVVVVVVLAPPSTPTTTPSPPPVMTEAPPRPADVKLRPKDCPLYVLGELRDIKNNGETWLNDGSACELCECVDGVKRCYYHYCNVGTEIVTNPPAGHPPLDDEDGGVDEEGEEGSGRPPPSYEPLNYKGFRKVTPGELRIMATDNDTRPPTFCSRFCYKACPWGYKMDPVRQCRRCSCRRRCPSLDRCPLRCPAGMATDDHGCPVCHCREEGRPESHLAKKHGHKCKESVRGCLDGMNTRQVGEVWSRGACVVCRCVADGYSECNVTQCPSNCSPNPHHGPHQQCCQCVEPAPPLTLADGVGEVNLGRAEVSMESAWERQVTYADPRTNTQQGEATGDGAVKSAVQAVGVQWWQVWLVTIPLAVLCVAAGVCGLRQWRRTHHDKYDINAYRPQHLTEKLRPVTTAEDHIKAPMM